MNRNHILLIRTAGASVAGSVLILLAGCSQNSSSVSGANLPATAPPVALQTTRAVKRDVDRVITLPADLLPMQEATLYAKVPGYLDRLLADKGDHVRAGQLLAVIRAPELGADVAQARQSYLSAMATTQV